MNKYLPSKKFIFIFMSIVLALSIIYAPRLLKKNKKTNLEPLKNERVDTWSEFSNLDSDNDGLKDWEEALWKTDPNNSDTDSDGTNDGEEIRLDRDPLRTNTSSVGKEPNDKIDKRIIDMREKASENLAQLNSTQMMSQELFTQYLIAMERGSSLTNNDILSIADRVLAYAPDIILKQYTIEDLNILSLSDNDTYKNYANKLAEILLINIKTQTEDIDTLITEASETTVSNENYNQTVKDIFLRFDPLINKNKQTVEALLNLSVPEFFVDEHLFLLNSFQQVYESIDLIQRSAEDLIVMVILRNSYDDIMKNLSDALIMMTNKVYSAEITFSTEQDYGFQFFGVIMTKN